MSWGSLEGYVGTEVGANGGGPIVYLFLNGLRRPRLYLRSQHLPYRSNALRRRQPGQSLIVSSLWSLVRYFCATKVAIVQRCQ